MKRRLLAMLLATVMLFGLLPTSMFLVHADNENQALLNITGTASESKTEMLSASAEKDSGKNKAETLVLVENEAEREPNEKDVSNLPKTIGLRESANPIAPPEQEDPEDPETPEVTRAQWIQSLVDTFDMVVEEQNAPDNYFSDLTGTETYYRDILVAVTFGVIDIEEGLPFYPDEPATREFAAQTMNACLSLQLDPEAEYTFVEAEEVTYPDDIQIAILRNWFALHDGFFLPNQAMTAEEASGILEDAAEVLAGEAIDPDCDNLYTYSVEVIEVPEGTEVYVDAENTVTIVDCPVEIQCGDVFIVYFGGIPFPYAAQSIEQEDNLTIIRAAELEEEDVFSDIEAQGSFETEFTQFVSYEGTEVTFVNEITGERFTDAIAAERSVKEAIAKRGASDLKRSIYIKLKVKLSETISGTVSFTIKDPKLDYKLSLSSKTAMVTLSGKYEASIKAEADFTEAVATKELQLLLIGVKGIGGLEVAMNYDLSGSATATYSGKMSIGVSFSLGNGFKPVRSFKADCFSLELEATFKAGIKVSLGVNDVPGDLVAGNVYAEIGAKGSVKYKTYGDDEAPHACVHSAIYLYLNYGATAHVKFGPFKAECGYKVKVWDDSNSPIRVVHHYEDGHEVAKCTRGGTDNHGYFTNFSSNYDGSGWSGGNNGYGLNVNGDPVLLYSYTVDADGNATITGYNGNARVLYIPESIDGHTVVAIGESSFKGKSIQSITLPDTVTSIEREAFCNCYALFSVLLSNNLSFLGVDTFRNCNALTSVWIPKTLTTVKPGYDAPNTVAGPFRDSGLKTAEIEEGATIVANYLFSYAKELQTVIMPDSITEIQRDAFLKCYNLQIAALPKSLVKLGQDAFRNCTSLEAIWIPKTLTTVEPGYDAPNTVAGPFWDSGLKTAEIEEGATIVANYLFSYAKELKTAIIPNSVTEIQANAFRRCISLHEIDLPKFLVKLGQDVFRDCTSLETIWIPKTLITVDPGYEAPNYTEGPFRGSGLQSAEIEEGKKSINDCLFSGASQLAAITIPTSVTSIGERAFRGTGFVEFTLPEQISSLGQYTFENCSSLQQFNWNQMIAVVPCGMFKNNTSLQTITLNDTVLSLENESFRNCDSLTQLTLPATIYQMGTYVFCDCDSLTQIYLPASLTAIPNYSFYDCDALHTITIPDEVTYIGYNAFEDCDALESVCFGSNVNTIKDTAFRNCDQLTEVQFNSGLKVIDYDAFYDCDSLASITIPDSVTSIGKRAFMYCDLLADVNLGTGIKTIPEQCFFECPALQKIELPYRVTTIGAKAFGNCTGLTEATILRYAEEISSDAFSYADILTIYGVAGTYAETYAGEIGATFVAIDVPATEITLNETNLRLLKGASFQLKATVTPANFTDAAAWKSTNTSVATVTDDGLVKAVGVGEAKISFVVGNKKAICTVTVVQPVTGISLNKTSLSMNAGETFQLTATVSPSNADNQEISWSSSNPDVASVDENGLVSAWKKGTATVTAAAMDGSGVTRTCTVTVLNNLIVANTIEELQSPHPYDVNCNDLWQYSIPGAVSLEVTFSTVTSVEEDIDYINVFSGDGTRIGQYTGEALAGKTVTIPGDTVRIQLVSDESYCEYGFAVTSVVPVWPEHDHDYAAVETVPPTCTESGSATYACTICGDSYVEITPALGHMFEDNVCVRCGMVLQNASDVFSDIEDTAYYAQPVLWAIQNGITTGTSANTFSPNLSCTRAQIVTFLWRAAGSPEPTLTKSPFYDVQNPNVYYYKPVLWAYENGITSGVSASRFGVSKTCSRAQVVTFLWRLAGSPEPDQSGTDFTDVPENTWYSKAVRWAVENEITAGTSETTFSPDQVCTRAQVVTFLYKCFVGQSEG